MPSLSDAQSTTKKVREVLMELFRHREMDTLFTTCISTTMTLEVPLLSVHALIALKNLPPILEPDMW